MERLRETLEELEKEVGLKNSFNLWRGIRDVMISELLDFLSRWENVQLR